MSSLGFLNILKYLIEDVHFNPKSCERPPLYLSASNGHL